MKLVDKWEVENPMYNQRTQYYMYDENGVKWCISKCFHKGANCWTYAKSSEKNPYEVIPLTIEEFRKIENELLKGMN